MTILKPISGLEAEIEFTDTGIKYFRSEELLPPAIFKKPPTTGFAILFDPCMLVTFIRLSEK